jgi:hypothetical protein
MQAPDKQNLIAKISPKWLLGEPIEAVDSAFYRVFRGVRDPLLQLVRSGGYLLPYNLNLEARRHSQGWGRGFCYPIARTKGFEVLKGRYCYPIT